MILLVDDLRSFLPEHSDVEHTIARTSAEGLAVLKAAQAEGITIDQLWLDHDLGGEDKITSVVDYIDSEAIAGRRIQIAQILVHTQNPVGGEQMIAALTARGYPTVRVRADDYLISE